MRTTHIYLLFVISILLSCEKEDEIQQKDSITFGSYDNINRQTYDTILTVSDNGLWLDECVLSIDINNDDVKDYKLEIINGVTPIIHPTIKILCLNSNSMLLGELTNDTTYYHEINGNEYYTCSKETEGDIITNIALDVFRIIPQKGNEILYFSDFFKSDTTFIINSNNSWCWREGERILCNFNHLECYNLPMNEDWYIGTKTTVNGKEKLGWIKFVIMDYGLLLLTESAIQK